MKDIFKDVTAATSDVSGGEAALVMTHPKNFFIRFITNKITLAFLIIIVLVLASAGTALVVYTWNNGLIAQGISISGINVSHLTKAEAQKKVESKISSILARTVKFSVNDKTVEANLGDLGLILNPDKALNEAFGVGRQGNLLTRALNKKDAAEGMKLAWAKSWDEKKLTGKLDSIMAGYNTPAKDATFTINDNNEMNIIPEKTGNTVNIAALIPKIESLNVSQPGNPIHVAFKNVPPKITAAELNKQRITGLIASYTTNFDPSETARTENVRLAAQALDHTVIAPGATFSFNGTVGDSTASKGYKDAYIIVNGKFVEGLGGGVCQVSSTLYNAVLLADLPIVQRVNHDLAITYVPLGQDATVDYPSLDLKFKNDTGGYLLIRTSMSSNQLKIDMYGQVKSGQEVTISDTSTEIPVPEQKVTDSSLAHGQEMIKQQGQPGYKATTTRVVTQNGKVIKTEQLPPSTYAPMPRIIEVGP